MVAFRWIAIGSAFALLALPGLSLADHHEATEEIVEYGCGKAGGPACDKAAACDCAAAGHDCAMHTDHQCGDAATCSCGKSAAPNGGKAAGCDCAAAGHDCAMHTDHQCGDAATCSCGKGAKRECGMGADHACGKAAGHHCSQAAEMSDKTWSEGI